MCCFFSYSLLKKLRCFFLFIVKIFPPPTQLNASVSPVFRFTLHAVDSRGSQSESSYVSVRTSCPMVDDSRAEGTADVATVRPSSFFHGSVSSEDMENIFLPTSPQYSYIT